MQENTLKQKLEQGKAVFGVMITFPSAPMIEMLGYLGFDWVLIDNEHGSITVENSEDLVRAAEFTGIAPIIRPVSNKPEIIAQFLEPGRLGCAGAPCEHRRRGMGGGGRSQILPRRPPGNLQPQPPRGLRFFRHYRRLCG